MNQELIRLVDSISRDKNIEKDVLFHDIEQAMVSAARKYFGQDEEDDDFTVSIDRVTGEISATHDGEPLDVQTLGRIAAQTAKQVMIQRIREAERMSLYDDFKSREGTILTGTVTRVDAGAITVNLGRGEGFMPRSEQIPGESHQVGERIRAMILEVRETPHQVKIVLTRSHPDFVRRLFELEVPEVAEKIIEMKALAREAGYRTKIAVTSIDAKVDALGACVGVRGSRVNNIVDELGGERVDIVRWNESSQILIANALKPAEISQIALCFEMGRAVVVVVEDQLSLAIGKRGQNVRLAARLTGWDIDILTPAEYNAGLDRLVSTLKKVEGVSDEMIDKVIALGMVSPLDVDEVGPETLVELVGVDETQAATIVTTCAQEGVKIQAEQQASRERADAARKAKEAAEAEWSKKLASGEMSVEEVDAARREMEAAEMERRAAELGLGGGPAKKAADAPGDAPAAGGEKPAVGGPLTLEQRAAMARQREQAAEQQEPPAVAPDSAAEAAVEGAGEDTPPSEQRGEDVEQIEPAVEPQPTPVAEDRDEAPAEPEPETESAEQQEQPAVEVEPEKQDQTTGT